MTARFPYLIGQRKPAIDVDTVRKLLNLKTDKHDLLIEVGITVCTMGPGVAYETWDVPTGPLFEEEQERIGNLVSYDEGVVVGSDGNTYVRCHFEPDRDAVARALNAVLRWCSRQEEILDSIEEEARAQRAWDASNSRLA